MTDYVLEKGDFVTLTAQRPCTVRVEDAGGIMYVDVKDLIEGKRADAARLLKEAEELEKERTHERTDD